MEEQVSATLVLVAAHRPEARGITRSATLGIRPI